MPKIAKIITAAVCVILGLACVAIIWVRDSSRRPEYCGLCHKEMGSEYSSWEASDYLANAHANSGVACQQCHPRTLSQSLREVVTYVRKGYEVPLPAQAHSDEECFRCHGSREATVQRTANWKVNPHKSHLIGPDIACGTCHKMHAASQDICAQCHEPVEAPGWTGDVTTTIADLGLKVYEPDMDCSVCHVMVPYIDSLADSKLEAYAHAQEGLGCPDCHEATSTAQVHEVAVPGTTITPRSFPMSFCFDCHVANEHTSWAQIAERTKGLTLAGEAINPHTVKVDREAKGEYENPHESGKGDVECSSCHRMHKGSPLTEFCWSCHHERDFTPCSNKGCHE